MANEAKPAGYRGRWAFVDLANRTVRVEPADSAYAREYVGGRGLQARLLADHLEKTGPLRDPLSPGNRIVIGTAALNDTAVATAGRDSCPFVGTMARPPQPAAWSGHHQVSSIIPKLASWIAVPNWFWKRAANSRMSRLPHSTPQRYMMSAAASPRSHS